MLSATLSLPGGEAPLSDPQQIRERLERGLDLVIDSGSCGVEPTTVIDLTSERPQVVRLGRGPLERIGIVLEQRESGERAD
jgi:tRNA A37 threonylcarbamoyladenosine synthetase subunit TsaC/SUA5/YrdC